MSDSNKHKRPKYTLEFKQDAAKLLFENSYTQQQAALFSIFQSLTLKKQFPHFLSRWFGAHKGFADQEGKDAVVLH